MRKILPKWHKPYPLFLACCLFFLLAALIADRPTAILTGLKAIIGARGTVGTDYISVGGLGAALANAGFVGFGCLLLMVYSGAKPNGAILMAMWMTVGFGFFGVNLANMLPATVGVWLYSRFQKEPFLNFSLTALLACTLAPVVSDIVYTGRMPFAADLALGVGIGILAGFLLPILAAATTRVHSGYCLYNIGFAGGVIAVFISALRHSTAEYPPIESNPSEGNNLFLAIFITALMLLWVLPVLREKDHTKTKASFGRILGHSGRLVSDYFLLYENAAFLNMAILGIMGTAILLLTGGQLAGSTLAGIFSMMAFGAFGKHPKNCWPVMLGAMLMAIINLTPFSDPGNMCALLFSTGLAPIAGQYGWGWGIVAGMLHMGIVQFTGVITGGLNLFNNGFAAGFVALLLVPVILAMKRGRSREA